MSHESLNIAIIIGSTRKGRIGENVGKWVLKHAQKRDDATYELLDVASYKLPLLGETEDTTSVEQWNNALAKYDGFVFVTAEYNHGLPGALKNAIDSARDPWADKAAGIVSYGSAYGARAAEQLRAVLGEVRIADVRNQVLLSLFTDFENYATFKPHAMHTQTLSDMLDQVVTWSKALKTIR